MLVVVCFRFCKIVFVCYGFIEFYNFILATITDAFTDGIKSIGHLSAGKITDEITDGWCEFQRAVH